MPWKSGQVVGRPVVAKIVEQQKGIRLRGFSKTEGAAQPHTGTFNGWLGLNDTFDGADRHEPGDPFVVAAPLSEGTKLNRNLPFVCEYLYRAFVHEQKG